jgi:hypothetical protein
MLIPSTNLLMDPSQITNNFFGFNLRDVSKKLDSNFGRMEQFLMDERATSVRRSEVIRIKFSFE